ncbi:hypothetical protein PIB30_063577 [Stylosanthes scabra]|uniref:Uncharacterized protein n=1 Tax=Stylosanthes scabra TaxID=79078 RepID=A0ABU6YKV5_9FABA|nr:hypothetical protein [Stylosanthes scabra]
MAMMWTSRRGKKEIVMLVYNKEEGTNSELERLCIRARVALVHLHCPPRRSQPASSMQDATEQSTALGAVFVSVSDASTRTHTCDERDNARCSSSLLCYTYLEQLHKEMEGQAIERGGLGMLQVYYLLKAQDHQSFMLEDLQKAQLEVHQVDLDQVQRKEV